MNKIWTIAKKEYGTFFGNPTGYIFAGLLFLVVNWMFWGDAFLTGQANLSPYWNVMAFLFSIFIPAISMNLIAEEKKNSTWEILLSMPINETEMVLGKFFGCALYVLTIMILAIPAVVSISMLGRPDTGILIAGVVATLYLAISYLAVGLFTSSLSNQPMVGFLVSAVFLILNSLASQDAFTARLPVFFKGIVEFTSLSVRANHIGSGAITFGDSVFFLSWCMILAVLTVMSLKSRDK
jgi:ABC-2 type transport system permease protein